MKEILIAVDGLSKKFCKNRYLSMKYGLVDIAKHLFLQNKDSVRLRKEEFFALKDVSFTVERGECLGVLGLNGAGKSTLLKLIAGVLLPDEGKVTAKGKIASIINFKAGLNMELTGKENIYFYYALHEKNKYEVKDMIDNIVATADLGNFIDAPLRTYSSGMLARLLVTMTIHIRSDILILDDVTFVGDVKFRKKCKYILNQAKKKTALIIASHTVNDLHELSDRIIVLDHGNLKFIGEKTKAINYYYDFIDEASTEYFSTGGDTIAIYDIALKSKKSNLSNRCNYGDECTISFRIKSKKTIKNYFISVVISYNIEIPLFLIQSEFRNGFEILEENVEKRITICVDKIELVTGRYYISFVVYDLEKDELIKSEMNVASFIVAKGPVGFCPVKIEARWQLH